ncbi:MAG: cytochrome c-type biogenesis protein CcmH [Zoogloeaceae bacterium]|nr:cytochrome c-type biogenesis protein CcmH [Zoogloeaceae bacterium]
MTRFALPLVIFLALAGSAQGDAPVAGDAAALDARVQELAEVLRCLVCQNQTVADSHAGLALDLKKEIRAMLAAGKSREEVIDFMVARYGDFVLYRPPVKGATSLLWFGPFLLGVAGLGVLILKLKRRKAFEPELTADEVARARAILGSADPGAAP